MKAEEAKRIAYEAYNKKMETLLNAKIESINESIEILSKQGEYDINVDISVFNFNYYLKIRKYYKSLGYKVSFPRQLYMSGSGITISWDI